MILDHIHGVANNTCDHPDCRAAWRRYQKRWKVSTHRGQVRTIDATPAREHIATLEGAGWTQRGIAAAAGVSNYAIGKIRAGQPRIRPVNAAAILAVDPRTLPPAHHDALTVQVSKVGTVRRIEALLAIGWPHAELRARSGVVTSAVLRQNSQRVNRTTHEAIATLYHDLAGRPGPSAKTRGHARAHGYLSPVAWHDIDHDPAPDLERLAIDEDHVDETVVERLLAGELVPATRAERDWVSGPELCGEAGITFRQFDYWCRTGLLHALPATKVTADRHGDTPIRPSNPGSGYVRWFHEDEVAKARTIRQLLDAGVSLQTIRQCIDQVLETGSVELGSVTITVHHPEEAS